MNKTIKNNGYAVTGSSQIIKEMWHNIPDGIRVNWHNFNENDIYFDIDGNEHNIKVNHAEKTVIFID